MVGTQGVVAVACAVLLAIQSPVLGGEDIPVASLPAAVTKAVQAKFPKGEILEAEKEQKAGQLQYEVEIRSEGKKYEVDVSPEGKILKVEQDD